ncbi:MAG: ABC transporter ATP-binding protein [Ignavibacteriota bacterium]|nr:ABC transporter ATP-binding protein [Ignavibacteriota bacterium]
MINIKNLKKSFGTKQVLNGVNLDIIKGETLVIIGKSGCGKSVLLKHILGLMTPDEGEVIIEGQNLRGMKRKDLYAIRKKFGFLFQGAALFDSMNVEENVGLGLRENKRYNDKRISEIVAEKLELVGLPGIQKQSPSDLSGGMKKRVSLARAIADDPEYILYDEPTTGLDPVMSDNIDELIVDLANKLKVTSIVVTHDIFSVIEIAERVVMMDGGVVYFSGTPKELFASDDIIIKEFLRRTTKEPKHL